MTNIVKITLITTRDATILGLKPNRLSNHLTEFYGKRIIASLLHIQHFALKVSNVGCATFKMCFLLFS